MAVPTAESGLWQAASPPATINRGALKWVWQRQDCDRSGGVHPVLEALTLNPSPKEGEGL
ncbi:MAG: hypothetical protein VKJ85_04880 [Prochlorothrix sp.]|nr:hypothetical protein [Prochlorothrix sp.]